MKAKVNDKIRIVNKMNDWSMDYKEWDIFTVESTWYGGVNVKSASGIPLSLDEVEYEILQEESPSDTGKKINVLFHADSERGIEKALQSAAGFLQYERGEKNPVELEILAEGEAVSGFQASSSNQELLCQLQKEGVKFAACKKAAESLHISEEEFILGIRMVESGIAELIEKQNQGFAYIKM